MNNQTTRIHQFITDVTINGIKLDLNCQMDDNNWWVKSIWWNGQDITKLSKCFSEFSLFAIRGHVSLDVLSKARKEFNTHFFGKPVTTCPGITFGCKRYQHTFLYN